MTTKEKFVTFRLTKQQLARLDEIAAKEDRSRSQVVLRIVEKALASVGNFKITSKQVGDVLKVKARQE
jgi:predicted transcriptional regulator